MVGRQRAATPGKQKRGDKEPPQIMRTHKAGVAHVLTAYRLRSEGVSSTYLGNAHGAELRLRRDPA